MLTYLNYPHLIEHVHKHWTHNYNMRLIINLEGGARTVWSDGRRRVHLL